MTPPARKPAVADTPLFSGVPGLGAAPTRPVRPTPAEPSIEERVLASLTGAPAQTEAHLALVLDVEADALAFAVSRLWRDGRIVLVPESHPVQWKERT